MRHLTSPQGAHPGMVFQDRDARRQSLLVVQTTANSITTCVRYTKYGLSPMSRIRTVRIRTDRLLNPRLFTHLREQAAARDVRQHTSSHAAARRLNQAANPNHLGGRPRENDSTR